MTKLTGGYFGTRGPDMFSPYFRSSIKGGAFIDLTAGTGQFPYHLATEYDFTIGLIERCPYVGKLLEAIFTQKTNKEVDWKSKPAKGYLTDSLGGMTSKKSFTVQQTKAFDGFFLANKNNGLALHCMARAISRYFLFRNQSRCMVGPNGEQTTSYKPEQVFLTCKRTYDKMSKLRLADNKHWVAIGDSTKVIKDIPKQIIKGGTVYADPAWPYAKQFGSANPYRISYEWLSSMMLQKQLLLKSIWTIDNREQIFADVETWITEAFKHGAKQFILCSQDTNSPDETQIKDWLKQSTKWKIRKHERSDDTSSFANRKYQTFWFYLEAK